VRFLPSVDEEASLLQASFTPSSRIAVVTQASGSYGRLPLLGLGDAVAEKLAAVTEKELGVKAIPLDHSASGDWAIELERFVNAKNVAARNAGREAFLKKGGFDGYLIVVFHEEVAPNSTYVLGSGGVSPEELVRYQPMFHIYNLQQEPLMRTDRTDVWACDTVDVFKRDGSYNLSGSARLMNKQACAAEFEKVYETKLKQRTAQYH